MIFQQHLGLAPTPSGKRRQPCPAAAFAFRSLIGSVRMVLQRFISTRNCGGKFRLTSDHAGFFAYEAVARPAPLFRQRTSAAMKALEGHPRAGTTASRFGCLGPLKSQMRIGNQGEPHDREIQDHSRCLRLDGSGRRCGKRRTCNTRGKDAGSGPTPGYTGQTTGTGTADTKQHPPTDTMNRVTGEKAASSQDAQKQMQGQPTAAQEAMGAEPTAQTADEGC
jgi:hypothetical protein